MVKVRGTRRKSKYEKLPLSRARAGTAIRQARQTSRSVRQDDDNVGAGLPVSHDAEQRLVDATEIVAYRCLELQSAELQH